MRFIHLYLIGYFVLVVGAGLALWQAGVLARVESALWIAIGAIIAVGLGIMLARDGRQTRRYTRIGVARDRRAFGLPSASFVSNRERAKAGTRCGSSSASDACSRVSVVVLAVLAILAAACKEEGTIKVHSLTFKGVKAVDESRLKNALATRQSSKMPWGKKRFFDRSRFDADLKRIQAFYADRGYPDARVTGFDVKLNDKQDAVDRHGHDRRRRAGRASRRSTSSASTSSRRSTSTTLKKRVPLKVGAAARPPARRDDARDGGQRAARSRLSLRARSRPSEDDRTRRQAGDADVHGRAGQARALRAGRDRRQQERRRPRHPPRADVQAGRSLSAQRGAGLAAAAVRDGAVSVRQRRAAEPGAAARRGADARHRRRGQASARELRRRLRHRGEGARRRRVPPCELPRRRAIGRRARRAGRRSIAACGSTSTSRTSSARTSRSAPKAQQWYTFTPAYHSTVTGGKADADAPRRASARRGRCRSRASATAARSRRTSLNDPTLRNDLIALGLDPTTGEQNGTLNALGFDFQHSTADNLLNAHRGYQIAFHAEEAGRLAARHLQLLRGDRPTPGTTCRSANGVVLASRAADRQHPTGRRRSGERAVLEEVLPRRRDEHPRLGPLRGQPARRRACRSAATACSRSARSCARRCAASSAACCSSTPATSGRESWRLRPRRSALRGRPGAPLPDAGRPDPLRLRLSAESDSRACS